MILLKDSEVPNQPVQMHRLIWAFAVHTIDLKAHFSLVTGLNYMKYDVQNYMQLKWAEVWE